MSPETALSGAEKWLVAGYEEIAPGVFRSSDGLRQFRMTFRGRTKGSELFVLTVGTFSAKLEDMPRPLRPIDDSLVYHVVNRGNNRQDVFHKCGDFAAFLAALADMCGKVASKVL